MSEPSSVAVVGATGGTGREVVERLAADGHLVTAFARTAHRLAREVDGVVTMDGDATDPEAVGAAVAGQDAVVVTLGIAENPLRVRLTGPARTPADVRSRGTRTVVEAARRHGARRLVVLSSFGVGETRRLLRPLDRLVLSALLRPQIADTEAQERVVRESGLEWVLVRPVHLDDGPASEPLVATGGDVRGWRVSRASVAGVLAEAATSRRWTGSALAVSG
ncbi:NAD(P)-binding oxidoreductase [Pseudokineococcus sp. 5B2Z-1]|uniref:NAD(P)-dependent oxidoreductase n=1 Tax=Pseudokineococcus sp. 5B2Z-1 TaxID=3132744 RepID=UPI00309D6FCC